MKSSRTVVVVVVSSRTDLYDDGVDVTSFSALDVVAIMKKVVVVVVLVVVGARRVDIKSLSLSSSSLSS